MKVNFEGQVHNFPDDATDDEVRSALEGTSAPAQPADPHEPGYMERVANRWGAIPGRIYEGITAKPITGGTEGRTAEIMKALGGFGALMEPIMAPVGEAARAGAEYLARQVPEETYPQPRTMSDQERVAFTGNVGAMAGETLAGFGRPGANLAAATGMKIPLLSKKVTPLGREMIGQLGYGGVRPAQVTRSPLTDFLDNIASYSMLGRGKVLAQAERGAGTVDAIAFDLARGMGQQMDPLTLGNTVRGIISEKDAAWRAAGNQLYRAVDEIHPEPAVNLGGVYETARKLSNDFPEGTEAGNLLKTIMAQTKPAVQPPSIDPFWRQLAGLPPEPTTVIPKVKTFLEANDLRSWTYAWKTPGLTSANDQAVRVGTVIGKALDEAIDDAGRLVNPAARAQLDLAGKHWKAGSDKFNTRLVRALLIEGKVTPEDVVSTFIKPGAITETRRLRELVGGSDSEAWGTVRRSFVEDIMERSFPLDTTTGQRALDAGRLRVQIDQWGDTAKEVLGGAHARELSQLADVLTGMQKTVAGGGGMLIQMKQAGVFTSAAAAGAGTAAVTGAAMLPTVGLFIITPDILARIFTNEKATRMLLMGLHAKPGSATAKRAVAVLSNFIQPGQRQSQEPKQSELEQMFFGGK